ncbi:MAG: FimB/Mfa2 family fimbrial subunit [Alistipes sp.]|nr:FimB/Mfa2 family fimbrial subunit [Alistipes sp.]
MDKKALILLLLLLSSAAWSGCTKEDYSNCPAGLYVTFAPENPKHNYARDVQNLELYFYKDDALAGSIHYTRDELRAGDRAAYIPNEAIAGGRYRMVAVVNSGEDSRTATRSTDSYERIHTAMVDEVVDYQPCNFFSGEAEITVPEVPDNITVTEVPVSLYKHNNRIRINIYHDEDYTPEGRIDARVEDISGKYFHARTRAGFRPDDFQRTVFKPWERLDGRDGSVLYLSTMHMWHSTSPDGETRLCIDESGATRAGGSIRSFSLNMTELLRKVSKVVLRDENGGETVLLNPYDTDEKLRFHDEYEISIKLGKTTVAVRVGLDDWQTVGGGIDL